MCVRVCVCMYVCSNKFNVVILFIPFLLCLSISLIIQKKDREINPFFIYLYFIIFLYYYYYLLFINYYLLE